MEDVALWLSVASVANLLVAFLSLCVAAGTGLWLWRDRRFFFGR